MPAYTSVSIIYNPISTGNGKILAEELRADLSNSTPKLNVSLIKTKYAGHTEKLAFDLARASKRPLIISASGDGGYHEVINGLVAAQKKGAHPVAGLLPAGNANDHFRNIHKVNTVTAILKGNEQRIDLLKLTATAKGKLFERYAHSYIGAGLTPQVGKELNKAKINKFNEIGIVLKELLLLKPISVQVNGKKRMYDSLVFSNVGSMSKILRLSKDSTYDDGMFEATFFRKRSRLELISSLLRATTTGLKDSKSMQQYSFTTLNRALLIQLDGELFTIDAHSKATISIDQKILNCIV